MREPSAKPASTVEAGFVLGEPRAQARGGLVRRSGAEPDELSCAVSVALSPIAFSPWCVCRSARGTYRRPSDRRSGEPSRTTCPVRAARHFTNRPFITVPVPLEITRSGCDVPMRTGILTVATFTSSPAGACGSSAATQRASPGGATRTRLGSSQVTRGRRRGYPAGHGPFQSPR